ncbi:MAG: hypothetical protein KU37_03290 [Sulfuricurvum sp. PC08-66]|nr:MAG: hypothetical protein KU37_03290 [Sulfuricurvum sp. PC08-66]
MIFEWDEKKAYTNFKKHSVTFEEASTVFGDWQAITIPDVLHSEEEERFIIVGKSEIHNILVVVHVEKSDVIRIISARKASKSEQKFYEEQS